MMDINSDMGEYPEFLANGLYANLMDYVISINLACGGHAGEEDMMAETTRIAKTKGVNVGAHPGYPDRENFGRVDLEMNAGELLATIRDQIQLLADITEGQGLDLSHVKAHGALYNRAARDRAVARTIGAAVLQVNPHLPVMGLSGSVMLDVFSEMGLTVMGEAFADRTYEMDGSLRNRKFPDALITDPAQAAKQAKLIAKGKIIAVDGSELEIEAQTICIHSDTPHALAIAGEVRMAMNK